MSKVEKSIEDIKGKIWLVHESCELLDVIFEFGSIPVTTNLLSVFVCICACAVCMMQPLQGNFMDYFGDLTGI